MYSTVCPVLHMPCGLTVQASKEFVPHNPHFVLSHYLSYALIVNVLVFIFFWAGGFKCPSVTCLTPPRYGFVTPHLIQCQNHLAINSLDGGCVISTE